MWFAEKSKLISANQVAFKKGHGTLDALLHFEHSASTVISNKGHLTALSLDFEKAYDRIGAHVVLEELANWKVGPKIYKFIKTFLSNRKFRVKLSNTYSECLPLENGIPQGSPISVTIFMIAFNKISQIISQFPVEHCIYADDVVIFSKKLDLAVVKQTFTKILNKICEWSLISGANLSFQKCNTLHICRKKTCNDFNFSYNVSIPNVSTLKILGIIFDSKLSFKDHCLYLRKKLFTKLNIVKFLSSERSQIHPNILINTSKALILSIIDYGLPIYGHHAGNLLKKLYAPYHSAIRRSIRAFPTSNIRNMLAEAGAPHIQERLELNTLRLIPKVFYTNNPTLHNKVHQALKRKRHLKTQSTIHRVLQKTANFDLDLKPKSLKTSKHPPWALHSSFLEDELMSFSKKTTSTDTFQQLFARRKYQLNSSGWTLIYTDGSKNCNNTSYAVVSDDSKIISKGLLSPYCSVFSSEAYAVKEATQWAKMSKGKFTICTDSLSTISAIQNVRNLSPLISSIRDNLIALKKKVKLMWVPGHCRIRGNEKADEEAKSVQYTPCYCVETHEKNDILRYIYKVIKEQKMESWNNYNNHYRFINPERTKTIYPATCSIPALKAFLRLRIGHCALSHQHLLNRNLTSGCRYCNSSTISTQHILDICPAFSKLRAETFSLSTPSELLKEPNIENISSIFKYISKANLTKNI